MYRPFRFKPGDIVECVAVNLNGKYTSSRYYLIINATLTKNKRRRYYEFVDVALRFESSYEDARFMDNVEYYNDGQSLICFRKVNK